MLRIATQKSYPGMRQKALQHKSFSRMYAHKGVSKNSMQSLYLSISWMLFFFDLSASLWRMFHQLFDRFGMKLCWNSTETFQRFGLTNVSAMLFLLGLVFETFFECFCIALGKFSTIFGRFWDESATVKQ